MILIPSYRADGDWRDLQLAVMSLRLYNPDEEIVVGWRGPVGPELDGATVWERPAEAASSAAAAWWLVAKTGADEFTLWSDDCVAQPDTLAVLWDDVEKIREKVDRVGIVGCRSNFAAGPQNVRNPNGSYKLGVQWDSEALVLEVPMVAPFVAVYTAELFADLDPPAFEWYSDNWHCQQLAERGYRHFVSRAYVHHVGMRSSLAEGRSMDDMNTAGLSGLHALQGTTDAH